MPIKINLSYTYEYEKEYILGLLKPLLDATKADCKVLDGHEYTHVYIPRKGSISLKNRTGSNM
jgi:hypothetical protein